MAIPNVSVGQAVTADTMNELITNVNSSPQRVVFLADGNWSVPAGVHRFKVTLVGGGGGGSTGTMGGGGEDSYDAPGTPGGSALMVSAYFRQFEPGTTFPVTVGAGGAGGVIGVNGGDGGTGGESAFSTTFSSSGGPGGGAGPTHGSATWPAGQPHIYHVNEMYIHSISEGEYVGYGRGGKAGFGLGSPGSQGRPGIVIIEW